MLPEQQVLMVLLQRLLSAQSQQERQALPLQSAIAVHLPLQYLTSRFRAELQALLAQQVQTHLWQWEQQPSVLLVRQREPSVTTLRKTGLRATTVVSG